MKKLVLVLLLTILFLPVTFAQNVGIGTTTPVTRLHVSGTPSNIATFNGGSQMWITLSESSIDRGYIGSFSGNPEDVDFGTYLSNTTGKVHLTTSNLPRLSVNPSGNVGIGIIDPEARLHLRTTNWIKTIFENDAGQPRGYIGSDNNGTLTLSSNAYWNGSAWVYPNTGNNSLSLLLHQPNEAFEFRVRPDGGSQSTAMVVKVNGNVGIGTTSPQQQLSVSSGAVIDQGNNNTGSITNTLRFGSSSGEAIGSKRNSGTGQYGLDFYTANNLRMSIANNGNVGIGTNNPGATLDINGDLNIQNSLLINNSAGNTGQVLVSNGNGAAPSWQNIAYSNNDRFMFISSNPNSIGASFSDTILFNTAYALSGAVSYNSNGLFTINKSGLYSIKGNFTGNIICTTAGPTYWAVYFSSPSGSVYLCNQIKQLVAFGPNFMDSETIPIDMQIYFSAGSTIYFYGVVIANATITNAGFNPSPISINLISE